jgi:iron complex outermembrane receptor protein
LLLHLGEAAWLGVFGRNITNKRIIAAEFVGASLVGLPLVGAFEPPRTVGVTLGYKF